MSNLALKSTDTSLKISVKLYNSQTRNNFPPKTQKSHQKIKLIKHGNYIGTRIFHQELSFTILILFYDKIFINICINACECTRKIDVKKHKANKN